MAIRRMSLLMTLFTVMAIAAALPARAADHRIGDDRAGGEIADWNDRDYDTPFHSHVRAGDLIGRDVVNERRETIGTIEDLVIGLEGRLQYLVIARGGVLGIGERLIAVPFAVVEQTGGDEADIMIMGGRQVLADAPSFDPVEDWPDFSNPDYRNELQQYFDVPKE